MNEAEFDALVERFIERGEDPGDAADLLASDDGGRRPERSQHEAELSGRVVNGWIICDLPAFGCPSVQTRSCVGETKIRLKLRMESSPA